MTIPTAEEWIKNNMNTVSIKDASEQLRIFAKMHVDAALSAALRNTTVENDSSGPSWGFCNEEVITGAYPIERIK